MPSFSAPIQDLRHALTIGALGDLNPLPWVFMTGNCLGWCAYAYYTYDPFVLASNFPGLILSLWLNQGAIKLQYLERVSLQNNNNNTGNGNNDNNTSNPNDNADDNEIDDSMIIINDDDNDNPRAQDEDQRPMISSPESMIFVPQEVQFYRLLLIWCTVLLWVGWIRPYLRMINPSSVILQDIASFGSQAEIIGLVTNINLILFFGAPLTTILEVWNQRKSSSIHRPTMYMNLLCATFWTGYGT